MIKISIIGAGNVAQHLVTAFAENDSVQLGQLLSRKKELPFLLPDSTEMIHNFEDLEEADLYIIAVTDDAIPEISSKLPFKNRLVVHTSGAVPLQALDENNRRGVFYPLQTFSQNRDVSFSEVPVCIETEFAADYQLVERIARMISEKVYAINSEQRKALHVAAVFVNNFTNHLYEIGNDICAENQIPFDILKPLIKETAEKIMALSPKEAQTGPAKRSDKGTIAAHLAFLTNKNQHHIYELLTKSIQENVKKL